METTDNLYRSESTGNTLTGSFYQQHQRGYVAFGHSCPCGKDVYLTYGDADGARHYRPSRLRTKAVYKCNICGRFHLTTKNGRWKNPQPYDRTAYRQELGRELSRYYGSENNGQLSRDKNIGWVLQFTF